MRTTTVGVLLVMTIVAFEAMSVATAMPTVVRSLHGMALYAWPFSAYLVASLLGIVVSGEVADRMGPARPLLAGLALFAAGLIVAGTAQTMVQMILGRIAQGLGGGFLIVVLYVMIGLAYPPHLHPKVFGLTAAGWVVPSLIGPVIAGSLAEHGHWRWVFLGIVPLVVVGAGLVLPGLYRPPAGRPSNRAESANGGSGAAGPVAANGGGGAAGPVAANGGSYRGGRVRWPFALLAGVGVVLFQLAGERLDALAIPMFVAAAVALVLAVRVLLPAGTALGRRGLPAVIAMRGLAAGAFFAVDTFVPLTLSAVHGYSPVAAGIPLAVGSVGWSSASWLQGRHPDLPRPRLVAIGMVGVVLAATLMAVVAVVPGTGWLAFLAWLLGGLGLGLVMPSVAVLTLEHSTDADRGRNSAGLQISDGLFSALTIGLGGVVVAAAEAGHFELSIAIGAVDIAMAGVAVVGVLLAARLGPARKVPSIPAEPGVPPQISAPAGPRTSYECGASG